MPQRPHINWFVTVMTRRSNALAASWVCGPLSCGARIGWCSGLKAVGCGQLTRRTVRRNSVISTVGIMLIVSVATFFGNGLATASFRHHLAGGAAAVRPVLRS